MILQGRSFIAAAALWLLTGTVAGHEALAHEQSEGLRQRLVGTWTLVAAQVAVSDGKTRPADDPDKGILVFAGDGRFAQIEVVPVASRIGSTSRVRGAEEQGGTGVKASVALFGTYTVDEATRTLTYRVRSTTIAHWDGIEQQWSIDSLTAKELRLGGPAGPMQSASTAKTWKRAYDGVAVVVAPRADAAR